MPDIYSLSENVSLISKKQYIIKTDGSVWELRMEKPSFESDFVFQKIDGIKNCVKICIGDNHTVALLNDGTVLTWGENRYGQLGNGTKKSSDTPQKGADVSNIVDISSGINHCMALRSDGKVYSWGDNHNGQIGNGKHTSGAFFGNNDAVTPVEVKKLTKVCQISAEGNSSAALLEDGTVWQWGIRTSINPPRFVSEPQRENAFEDIVQISAGRARTLALTKDGKVWQWGIIDDFPALDPVSEPPEMVDGLPKTVTIATGVENCSVITENGEIWMWGSDLSIPREVLQTLSPYDFINSLRLRCVISADDIKKNEQLAPKH
jgi:alpha-tubulin suppressor-like RCC1 family protein